MCAPVQCQTLWATSSSSGGRDGHATELHSNLFWPLNKGSIAEASEKVDLLVTLCFGQFTLYILPSAPTSATIKQTDLLSSYSNTLHSYVPILLSLLVHRRSYDTPTLDPT